MLVTSGKVFWVTGLSGAGKTTICKNLYQKLKPNLANLVLLDGDECREVFGNDLGHDQEHRIKNAYRISRLAQLLSRQSINVLVSTMSLYPEIWEWNRKNILGYNQIYLKVNAETVKARDPKGLYNNFDKGSEKNIIGQDLSFSEPINSDLVIDNNGSGAQAIAQSTERIYQFISQQLTK